MKVTRACPVFYAFAGNLVFDDIAYMSPGGSYQYAELDLGDEQVTECEPACANIYEEHVASEYQPESLSSVVKGKKHADLLWGLYDLAVTDKVLEIFTKGGVSGFDARPVNIECEPRLIKYERLWYLYITGKAQPDMKQCGIRLEYKCPLCGHERYASWDRRKGLRVLEGSWDGSDMFRMYAPKDYDQGKNTMYGYVFATQKVLDLVRDNDLRPACFVDIRKMR